MDKLFKVFKTVNCTSDDIYYTVGLGSKYSAKCVATLNKNINKKQAVIKQLFVKEEFRGKGYGKHLLQYVEEDLKQTYSVSEIVLNAKEEGVKYGKLEKYYVDLGYSPVRHRFLDVDGVSFKLIYMVKNIKN